MKTFRERKKYALNFLLILLLHHTIHLLHCNLKCYSARHYLDSIIFICRYTWKSNVMFGAIKHSMLQRHSTTIYRVYQTNINRKPDALEDKSEERKQIKPFASSGYFLFEYNWHHLFRCKCRLLIYWKSKTGVGSVKEYIQDTYCKN